MGPVSTYRVVGSDGKEYGPVTADQIRQWIVERRLMSNSLLQTPDSTGWRPLTMFPEFTTTLASVAPMPLSSATAATGRPNNSANWGLGLSCVSLLCCGCGVLSVLGIVFSSIGLSQANRDPAQTGKSVAIAGIVVGALSLLGSILAAIFGVFAEAWQKLL
jgi:hypothetical protein